MMAPSVEELKQIACDTIDEHAGDLHKLSQEIFDHPELAFNEHRAHDTLVEYFEKNQFPVEGHYVLDTGFRSLYNPQDAGPNIAVLCEYDALPGIGHACGHNLIAEVGAATGIGIKAALDAANKEGTPLGKLTIYGTPAEENGGGGKIDFLNSGAFSEVTAVMMAHPGRFNIPNLQLLANVRVNVKYHGKASHAAGFPWEGINALDAAVLAYQNIGCLRQQKKPTCIIHGIISNGGTKPNIIPEESSLDFVMRAVTKSDLEDLVRRTTACFDGASAATGCKVSYEWGTKDYLSMYNVPSYIAALTRNQTSLGVVHAPESVQKIARGSSDIGNVSQVVPAIQPVFEVGAMALVHTRDFTSAAGAENAQPFALRQAKALAMTAIDLYKDPGLVSDIQREFAEGQT